MDQLNPEQSAQPDSPPDNTRPRVLLDVDGVLADFVGAYLDILSTEIGVFAKRELITEFDIGKSLGLSRDESARVKRAIGNREQLARKLDVYPGAIEGVARLAEIADVYIVTSPWNSNPTWCHDREHWLREHFGIPHSRVVHTSAKYLCRGDFLVDDKTDTLGKWQAENPLGTAVQWKTPHNRRDEWTGYASDAWDDLIALVNARARLRSAERRFDLSDGATP